MFKLIPLGQFLHDLTDERIVRISNDDEVVEPTISTKNHEISIADVRRGIDVKVKKRIRILNGDLVFSRLHTQNGAFAFANREFLSTPTFVPFSIDETKIDKSFLFWALHVRVPSLSSLDTVGRETYKTDDILKLEIPYSTIETQKKIASVLNKALTIKTNKEKINKLIDQLDQKIFLKMFGDPIINPKNWKINSLEEVCETIYRYPTFYGFSYTSSGIPVIKIGNIQNDGTLQENISNYNFISSEINEHYPKTILKFHDVLMAVRGDGSTGKMGYVSDKIFEGANISPNLLRFNTKRELIHPLYLYHVLSSKSGQELIRRRITRTAKKTITARELKNIEIPTPPLDLQNRFAINLQKIHHMRKIEKISLNQINQMYYSVQQRIFKDELIS